MQSVGHSTGKPQSPDKNLAGGVRHLMSHLMGTILLLSQDKESVVLKQQLMQFQNALQGADCHPLPREQAGKRLPALIAQFESRPENRARTRVRRVPRQRVCRTLKHLNRAAAASARSGPVGGEARKLLRAIRTSSDFETLEKRASAFIGFQNRVARRRNERERRKREPVIQLGGSLALRRVDTVEHLTTIGRALKLCVAQPGSRYQRYLRNGILVFWSIQRAGKAIGLLSIDADANEVEECDGFDHEPLELSRSAMLEILRKLNATADNCDAFASVGALSLFLERPAQHPNAVVRFQGSCYQAWGWSGRVAINKNQRHWSLFRWRSETSEWVEDCYHDDDDRDGLSRLVDLVSHFPEIAKLVREQRALAATSSK